MTKLRLESDLPMRTCVATLAVVFLTLMVSVAQATPTQVNMRIEGKSVTLFEGPIWTEGHDVKASSDSQARPCDGTNDHQHATPGPTPTVSAVDAMRIIGETFDAQWYPGYDDYFLTRFGPDEQSTTEGAYWGILVNNVFTSVGGCQYELGPDNEVLWVYDAFAERPFLALLSVATSYGSGPRPLTATAELDEPFEVEVTNYTDQKEDKPPADPERTGSSPYEGAVVSPVLHSVKGFEQVETADPETVTTNADGKAVIIFTTPGWHRIKATAVNSEGEEAAVRSNRLDVCVPAQGASGCGEPPVEDRVRTPPHTEEAMRREEAEKRNEGEVEPGPEPEGKSEVPPATATLSIFAVTPFNVDIPPGRGPSTAKRPTVAKRHSHSRCVRVRGRRASHRHPTHKCKTAKARLPKPRRAPRHQRRGRRGTGRP